MNPKDASAMKKGKVRLDLNPPAGSEALARALASGANKYGPWNWRKDPIQLSHYVAAMKRHLDALMRGEDCAPDSGVHHLGHIMAGAAIVLDASEQGCLIDDRPNMGRPQRRKGEKGQRRKTMAVRVIKVMHRGRGGRRGKRKPIFRPKAGFGEQE